MEKRDRSGGATDKIRGSMNVQHQTGHFRTTLTKSQVVLRFGPSLPRSCRSLQSDQNLKPTGGSNAIRIRASSPLLSTFKGEIAGLTEL